jgi:hypothetical protein
MLARFRPGSVCVNLLEEVGMPQDCYGNEQCWWHVVDLQTNEIVKEKT